MCRIGVFTGSRADYGPLVALLRKLVADAETEPVLLVSGGHLSAEQGRTIDLIRADGFPVHETVDMLLASDTAEGVTKSFGLGVIGYADALARLRPDIFVVLGDRYEALAVSIAAILRNLPLAHIAGGQVTSGSLDDSMRHAITKLAHLHFPSTEAFADRIVQLGEDPARVHVVGALGLDTIASAELLTREQLLHALGLVNRDLLFAVTYHPATAEPDHGRAEAREVLDALDLFPEAAIAFTGTNVDRAGATIGEAIMEYAAQHSSRAMVSPSLGHLTYLSLVRHADVVIGNSSSGIIEAPALHTPTVNIGSRQDGRPRARSVLDCTGQAAQIAQTIRQALTPTHRLVTHNATSPYGDGKAAEGIIRVLKGVQLDGLVKKVFFDTLHKDENFSWKSREAANE